MFTHELFKIENATDDMVAQVKVLVESDGEDSIDLKQYRKIYRKATGEPCPLSDDELIFMIAGVNDDLSEEEWVEVMKSRATGEDDEDEDGDTEADEVEDKEPVVVSEKEMKDLKALAIKFGKQLDTGSFVDTMFDIQIKDEESKRGIGIMLFDRYYGPNKWSKDTWDSIPDPRLDKDALNALKKKGSNVIPWKWSYKEGQQDRVGDFFRIAVCATAQGAALAKSIEDHNIAMTDNNKNKEQQELASLGADALGRRVRKLEKRLDNIVNRLKRMVKAKLLMDEINALSDTIKCDLICLYDKAHKKRLSLTDDLECFMLQKIITHDDGTKEVFVHNSYIPNTFLRLDPKKVDDKAVEAAGSYAAALDKTKDRVPQPGGKDYPTPTSPEKFLGVGNALLHYFAEDTNNFETFQKYWAKEIAPDTDDILETGGMIREVAQKYGMFYTFIRPALEKAEKERNEKVKAENTAKAKAIMEARKTKAA